MAVAFRVNVDRGTFAIAREGVETELLNQVGEAGLVRGNPLATGEPDAALAGAVANAARAQGVVTLTCGTYGNIIRLLPPLTISDELLTEGIDIILEGLAQN